MEDKHKSRLRQMFPREIKNAVVHVLDIPDEYQRNDPELIELIRTGTESIIKFVQT